MPHSSPTGARPRQTRQTTRTSGRTNAANGSASMARNPMVPVLLAVVLGLQTVARGLLLLGPVSSPMVMFVFGALDLLYAAALLLALPPIRYVGIGVFGLQVVVAIWQALNPTLLVLGVLAPAGMLGVTLARRSQARPVFISIAALGLFAFFVAGGLTASTGSGITSETLAEAGGAGSELPGLGPSQRRDTGFGIGMTRPAGFTFLDDADDLPNYLTAPKPSPGRLMYPYTSSDKSIAGFVMVERVAVIQGVPAKSFATRIAEGLPSDISGEDAPAPAKVVPSRLPPAWGKAEHVTVDYSWAGHGLSLTGIVAVLKVTDGRVISVTAVGPAMAEERVRRAVETLAGTLTIAGVGIGQ